MQHYLERQGEHHDVYRHVDMEEMREEVDRHGPMSDGHQEK